MIFVTGAYYAGKRNCIRTLLGLSEEEFAREAVWDVQELAEYGKAEAIADRLAGNRVVIATEIGCGVIPVSAAEREKREAAGQLACALAARADTVIRVCCGIPQLLKGEWPCASC